MINKCHRIDKEQAKNNGLTAITCFPSQQNDATLQRRAAECRAEKSPAWQDKEMGVRVDGEIGIKDKKATTREGALKAMSKMAIAANVTHPNLCWQGKVS